MLQNIQEEGQFQITSIVNRVAIGVICILIYDLKYGSFVAAEVPVV